MKRIWTVNVLAAALLLVVMGCDSSGAGNENEAFVDQDVAESVASISGEDTGGILDEVTTVLAIAQSGSMGEPSGAAFKLQDDDFARSYDGSEGIWTITRVSTRGDSLGLRYAIFTRIFTLQFKNADGEPQKYYETNGVRAASIEMNVLEGGGEVHTPHLSAQRTIVAGRFLATNTDTDTVTVNGNYTRSGSHEITRDQRKRTLEYQVQLELIDVVGPRGSRRDLSEKISGTINGVYVASHTIENPNGTFTKNVSKTITIVINDGVSEITVDGQAFNAGAGSGELGS